MTQILGCFIGVGVGPGDPDLMTLKAAKAVADADVVAYPATLERESTAYQIAAAHVQPHQQHILMRLPMSKVRGDETERVYDHCAAEIEEALRAGKNVAFLCLGDPLLYGTFIYLFERLRHAFECRVIPGITSVSAACARGLVPLTRLEQSLLIIPGLRKDDDLREALNKHESLVIMKAGRVRHRIAAMIAEAGKTAQATYIEHATMEGELVIEDITQLPEGPGSYFSLFLVAGSAK